MRAGKLRHKVSIVQKTSTGDGLGGFVTSSGSTFAAVFANIFPLTAREIIMNTDIEHEITHLIEIRHLSGIKPDMEVWHGSRKFRIEGIRNIDERDIKHMLTCRETT